MLHAEVVLSHVAERSVLHDSRASTLQAFVVAGRKRLATCSGVAWFRGYHLAVVNLYGGHLRIYRFDPDAPRIELLHEISQGIACPEDVAVAPDASHLAVTHSLSDDFGVSLHALDPHTLAPEPGGETLRRGRAFHGLRFSPDSRHLAFTEVGAPGYVEVVCVASPGRERSCWLENRHAPLKPKAIAFSRDERFVVIARTLNIAPTAGAIASSGMLSVHRFDASNGIIADESVAWMRAADISLGNVEMCTFLPTEPGAPYRILAANQGQDAVCAFDLDAERGTLAFSGIFASDLSFPHGLDVSADGRFVAITNYGDDTLRIVRVAST